MEEFQLVQCKGENELSKEWDEISQLRFEQITQNKDLSFEYILNLSY